MDDTTGPPVVPVPVSHSRPTDKKEEAGDSSPLSPTKRTGTGTTKEAKVKVAPEQFMRKTTSSSPKRNRLGLKKRSIRPSFKTINAALYHPHEDTKGIEMRKRIGIERGGIGRSREEQHADGGTAPMPGTAFWQSMLITSTDANRPGNCGGLALDPPLRVNIPATVVLSDFHAGGLAYACLYNDEDGYIYRVSLEKELAMEWLTRMYRRYINKCQTYKAYKPEADEPKWVLRKPNTDGMAGHQVRAIVDDAGLRAAFSEANSMFVNIWQVYIRGPGVYQQICRVVHDFTGLEDDRGHYAISCTHETGSKLSFDGGYFVDSNNVSGTKAQGRVTIVSRVLYNAWQEHVETAVYLTNWVHAVYPYRRQPNGTMKQKLPKFSPDYLVMDFLVGRDGTWFFSNTLVLRGHRWANVLKKVNSIPPPILRV